MKQAEIAATVERIRRRMVESGEADDYRSINHGLCGDFAEELAEAINRFDGRLAADVMDVANFIRIDPRTGFSFCDGGPFDRDLIKANFPAINPPGGMTWDDLDLLSRDCGFSAGTHVFTYYDGRFYDAEAPSGVANFFELPFFERVVSSWLEERAFRERGARP